jgi:hypothetical protein
LFPVIVGIILFIVNTSGAEQIQNGFGRTKLPDGTEYEGEFKNGLFNGHGTLIRVTEIKYEVEINGVPTQHTRTERQIMYKGEFKDGHYEGKGKLTLKDGTEYEGEFKNGKPNGRSILHTPNGDRYEGEIKDGLPNGTGILIRRDGARYEGQFKDGNYIAVTPTHSSTQDMTNYFTVNGIPLGATIQDVSDILQQKGIRIDSGAKELRDDSVERNKKSVIEHYRAWNLDTKNVEENFKEKFKPFLFNYGGKQYYLDPVYFYYFIDKAPGKTYPLFETDYNLYDSYFDLYSRTLPGEMRSIGLVEIHVLFASINGAEPKSFALIFRFNPQPGNAGLFAAMNKKYGKPKVYYGSMEEFPSPGDDFRKADLTSLLNSFKKYLKDNDIVSSMIQQESKKPTCSLDPSLLFRSPEAFSDPFDVFYVSGMPYYFTTWNFEWMSNDIKISSQFEASQQSQSVIGTTYSYPEKGNKAESVANVFYPLYTAYVQVSTYEKVIEMVNELINKSKSMIEKTQKSGLGQF